MNNFTSCPPRVNGGSHAQGSASLQWTLQQGCQINTVSIAHCVQTLNRVSAAPKGCQDLWCLVKLLDPIISAILDECGRIQHIVAKTLENAKCHSCNQMPSFVQSSYTHSSHGTVSDLILRSTNQTRGSLRSKITRVSKLVGFPLCLWNQQRVC